MEKIGWLERKWNRKILEVCEEEVERKMKDIQELERREKLEKTKFAKKLKIIGDERNIYKKVWVKETKKGLETLARFRIGSETKEAKYWEKEEEKLCRVCRKEPEDTEHVLENMVDIAAENVEVLRRVEKLEKEKKEREKDVKRSLREKLEIVERERDGRRRSGRGKKR